MARGSTRRGRSGDGTDGALPLGFKQLVSLRAEVTVSCHIHREHTATVTGPWRDVLNAVGLFRGVATEMGRWVMIQYEPSEELLPSCVTDWEPELCQ